MHSIFSYGTLSDKEFQKYLFDRELKMCTATLEGYKLYSDIDGYYYVEKCQGEIIKGKIIEVNDDELDIIEFWEEVPMYIREKCKVTLEDGSKREAGIYFKRNVKEKLEITGNDTTINNRSKVIDNIKKMKECIKRREYPNSDLMVVYPAKISNIELYENCIKEGMADSSSDFLIKYLSETVTTNYCNEFNSSIERYYFGHRYIYNEILDQYVDIYISVIKELNIASVLINIPNIIGDTILLKKSINSDFLLVRQDKGYVSINKLMLELGINICGQANFISYLHKLPNQKMTKEFLAGEITHNSYDNIYPQDFKLNDISTCNSIEIYGAYHTFLVIQNDYENNYFDRAKCQTFIYNSIELSVLQEALINNS